MNEHSSQAIQDAINGKLTFCKFLSANDTGKTGGHQAGIYISKPSISILFNEPGMKGSNKEKWVKIEWQDNIQTETRFIYYGQGTRNEYRITNFGKGFPFLRTEYTGALFILIKMSDENYKGYVLNTETEINEFFDAFGIGPTETNKLIEVNNINPEVKEKVEMESFISKLDVDFPTSQEMSAAAREIYGRVTNKNDMIISNPDKILVEWTDTEYKLFRYLEYARYMNVISKGFDNVDTFVSLANQVLNRRKSRAGKSLEHHLAAIFDGNGIRYSAQAVTEKNKKPDFIFPSQTAYHDITFSEDRLITLAAKTTCKDRWRQILNEADRLRDKNKFLCTLQQGISAAQMDEMEAEKVILVVPKQYISSYPKEKQDRIWTIGKFVNYLKEIEGL